MLNRFDILLRWLPKPNKTLLLYPGLGPTINIGGVFLISSLLSRRQHLYQPLTATLEVLFNTKWEPFITKFDWFSPSSFPSPTAADSDWETPSPVAAGGPHGRKDT